MKLINLLNKSVKEQRDIYIISDGSLHKIQYIKDPILDEYSQLLFQCGFNEWDVANLTSLWFQVDDYVEISEKEFNEQLSHCNNM